MVETISNQSVAKELNALMEVEYDAIAAYVAAIERLESEAFKSQLRDFMRDHERHVRKLNVAVMELGDEPVKKGDLMRLLTKGKVVVADLFGDKAILMAMKTNEDQTNKAYENILKGRYPEDIRRILLNGLSDERHHRDWITAKLNTLE